MSVVKLFNNQGGIFTLTEYAATINTFKNIQDEYGDNSPKIWAFLHYMKSLDKMTNPFFNIPEEEKEEIITRQICPEIDTDTVLIKDALELTEKCYTTAAFTVFKGFKMMMEKLGIYLQDNPLTTGQDGNMQQVIAAAKAYPSLNLAFKEAYKEYEEELGNDQAWGGANLAYDEGEDDDIDS